MRDFDFIHAAEDVKVVLRVAAEAGLIVREGDSTPSPHPVIIDVDRFGDFTCGQFVGYREEWIFGDLRIQKIEGGAYEGQYSISPGVNSVGIGIYFMGERQAGQRRRLGNGIISRRVDWYSPEDHEVYKAPYDVKKVFDAICKQLDTGKRVRTGGRTYHLLECALEKIKNGYLPPFDFIEWPPALLGP